MLFNLPPHSIYTTTLTHIQQVHECQLGLKKGSDIMCLWSQWSLATGLSAGEMRHCGVGPIGTGQHGSKIPLWNTGSAPHNIPLTPGQLTWETGEAVFTPARLLHASGHTLMLTWTCMLMLQLCFFHLVTMLCSEHNDLQ